MAKLMIEIELSNAAFADYPTDEVRRMLRNDVPNILAIDRAVMDGTEHTLRDVNGNIVGRAYRKGKKP